VAAQLEAEPRYQSWQLVSRLSDILYITLLTGGTFVCVVHNKFKTHLDEQYAKCEKIILGRMSNI